LDFGCGVGRLTQALAPHAERVVGVDIAPSMVERARALAAGIANVAFEVGDSGDLRGHPDGSCDLLCSFLVLQHIPTEIALGYVSEFVRVLRPGGVAVFGAPSEFVGASVEAYALPPDACRAEIGLANLPLGLAAGAAVTVDVTVVNRSPVLWPRASAHEGGLGRIHVGDHWTQRGRRVVEDDGRSPLPADVPPGGPVTVPLRVTAPARPGVYGLEVDLVQEGVCWFADRGSPVARRRVVVVPARRGRPATDATGHDAGAPLGTAAGGPPVFAMHPLPEGRVRAAVAAAGGRVALVAEEPGDGWRSLRYAVVRDG
ncbi:MAG TPA: class I SAM-dependent methyltransferase, partial [Candidatus Dormibacteraeota bacterium]|nr:class I SAM-dependent methyltransferase [Candidatus Dormibacteraeota bacterium]